MQSSREEIKNKRGLHAKVGKSAWKERAKVGTSENWYILGNCAVNTWKDMEIKDTCKYLRIRLDINTWKLLLREAKSEDPATVA